MNDADIEMQQLEEAGNMAHAGVCSLCGDILNAHHPKWTGKLTLHDREGNLLTLTPDEYQAGIGPVHDQLPWHVWCMKANGIPV